jgi:lariat debranching enzyme
MSHDWPHTIEQYGDLNSLLARKPFWRTDIETGQLGSPPLMEVLKTLRPKRWFAAHMHIRFEATISHVPTPAAVNPDEILIDDDDFDEVPGASVAFQNNPDEILLEGDDIDSSAQETSNGIRTSSVSSIPSVFTNTEVRFLTFPLLSTVLKAITKPIFLLWTNVSQTDSISRL